MAACRHLLRSARPGFAIYPAENSSDYTDENPAPLCGGKTDGKQHRTVRKPLSARKKYLLLNRFFHQNKADALGTVPIAHTLVSSTFRYSWHRASRTVRARKHWCHSLYDPNCFFELTKTKVMDGCDFIIIIFRLNGPLRIKRRSAVNVGREAERPPT